MMCVKLMDISHGNCSRHTRVATLLDTLSPVWDASGRVSWINDVALVARGTMKRLVSILGRAAGLSWWTENIWEDIFLMMLVCFSSVCGLVSFKFTDTNTSGLNWSTCAFLLSCFPLIDHQHQTSSYCKIKTKCAEWNLVSSLSKGRIALESKRFLCVFVCTHPAEPPPGRLTASRCPPTTEAWAAPASPALFRTGTDPVLIEGFSREKQTPIFQTQPRATLWWFCWPGGGWTDSRQA